LSNNESDTLSVASTQASEAVERLSQELGVAKKLAALLQQLKAYRHKDWPLHIKALCEKDKAFLADLRKHEHPAISPIEEIYRDSKDRAGKAIERLPRDIEKLAKQAGISIDTNQSRHPKYHFLQDGFVEVRIDDKKQTASLGNRESKGPPMPADARAIIEAVASEQRRLFERGTPRAEFLAAVYKAYQQLLKKEALKAGDPVPLRHIYTRMADDRKDPKAPRYQADEFLIDMSSLAEHGPGEIEGMGFTLQQTKDTDEGILLIGPAGRGMVSLIRFHPKGQSES
jgi:hypothetical protein